MTPIVSSYWQTQAYQNKSIFAKIGLLYLNNVPNPDIINILKYRSGSEICIKYFADILPIYHLVTCSSLSLSLSLSPIFTFSVVRWGPSRQDVVQPSPHPPHHHLQPGQYRHTRVPGAGSLHVEDDDDERCSWLGVFCLQVILVITPVRHITNIVG